VRDVSGDLSNNAQIHFALDNAGQLVAASGFGTLQGFAKEMRLARMLVERATPIDANILANPDVKLKSLL
jgi:3-phenylpropionate/trans-cinnamate dioxygenase ferredoxin reductase subunit